MEGLSNTLQFIQNNWSNIIVIFFILIIIITKVLNYFNLSNEGKVEIALNIVKNELLKLMCEAEVKWAKYKKSGELKKSYVISEIYDRYPVLSDYINQDELIEKITNMIDENMDKMNKIINNINNDTK